MSPPAIRIPAPAPGNKIKTKPVVVADVESESTKKVDRRRSSSSLFKPGRSGNPTGRPATPPEVRDLIRASTMDAVNRLREIIANGSDQNAIEACKIILDRALGKTPIPIMALAPEPSPQDEAAARIVVSPQVDLAGVADTLEMLRGQDALPTLERVESLAEEKREAVLLFGDEP